MDVRHGTGRWQSVARRARLATRAAAAVMVVVGLAACGGDGDDTTRVASLGDESGTGVPADDGDGGSEVVDAPTDPEEAMLAFAQCMREHGIDMPDPDTSGGGMSIALGDDVDRETMDAANEACGPLMANAVSNMELDPEREAEMREEMLAFTECMREHGIDMPDPTFAGDGSASIVVESVEDAPATVDRDSGAFAAAAEQCGGGMVVADEALGDG